MLQSRYVKKQMFTGGQTGEGEVNHELEHNWGSTHKRPIKIISD